MLTWRKIVKPELRYLQESDLAANAKAAEGEPLPVVLVESEPYNLPGPDGCVISAFKHPKKTFAEIE